MPCIAIAKDKENAYKYTNKGNSVAVITNGSAVLGLGNIGSLASKPVMEGKAVFFNKFAGVEAVDICVDAQDPDEFINCVKLLGPSFGGINLENIKTPDCFKIETELKKLMDIPVFHDDQHGTAIVCLAGLINAIEITKRNVATTKIVFNGAGAAGIACMRLMTSYGIKKENIFVCDTRGIIYKGRGEGMTPEKEEFARDTDKRTLEDALEGADVFIGLSVKGALKPEWLSKMSENPIIFAMALPEPEITPDEAQKVRNDCVIATGRADYPN